MVCSKIVLFGEYLFKYGGSVLSIPFPHFCGKLAYIDINSSSFLRWSNSELKTYFDYLYTNKIEHILNLGNLKTAIENGLCFDSDIPSGYGVGSSGALVVALYRDFAEHAKQDINVLKDELGTLEHYFHGNSSGLDPLVSFLKQPIFVDKSRHIKLVSDTELVDCPCHFFLIDSGIKRSSKKIHAYFNELLETGSFIENLIKSGVHANNQCVDYLMKIKPDIDFLGAFSKLSKFQLDFYVDIIPGNMRVKMEKGINSGEFYLKICGAGGGGFFLGVSQNDPVELFEDCSIIKIN